MGGDRNLRLEKSEESSSIVTSTIYKLKSPGDYSGKYSYSRYGNPTRDSLENCLACLDKANCAAVTFSSKIAASLAVLSSLQPDDRVVFSDLLCFEKLRNLNRRFTAEFVDFSDKKSLEKTLNSNTKLVWIASPTCPLMNVLDIKAIAGLVHDKSEALLVVDNTFLTPHVLKPLNLRADIVLYSLGEFVGGHSDVTMGAVITNDEKMHQILKYYQYAMGAVPSPFDCFLISRSLKTLSMRMEKHCQNALEVAKFLSTHSKVGKVFHSQSENQEVSNRKMCKSGILSFTLKGSMNQAEKFLASLKMISVTDSFGGTESSASLPWSMSHGELSEDQRISIGVTENLILLSIGLEDNKEVIQDLEQALENV